MTKTLASTKTKRKPLGIIASTLRRYDKNPSGLKANQLAYEVGLMSKEQFLDIRRKKLGRRKKWNS